MLLEGMRAFVATRGAARCYLQGGGHATLEAIAPGPQQLSPGDAIVAASRDGLPTGKVFIEGALASPMDEAFHNDGLDAALEKALSSAVGALLAVSAAKVGS